MRVAIIGCGITGPACALFLNSKGWDITLFDKVDDLKPVGAGFLLQPAGLHVLYKLGLSEILFSKGVPIKGLHGINHRGKTVLDLKYRDLVSYHTGLGMHRSVLYDALFEQLKKQAIAIINPCEIKSMTNKSKEVVLHDSGGNSHGPYDLVIIADGARSKLRECLKIRCKVKPYQWGALWAIAKDSDNQFNNTLQQVYHHAKVMSGILPMGYQDDNRLVSFFWSLHQSALTNWQDSSLSVWKNQVRSYWPELDSILDQLSSHDALAFANYYDVKTYPWHDNRVVIIGDSAHGMSPQLGQGANLGLIDAMVLSECLQDLPIEEALIFYSQRRKSQLRYYQSASRFVTPWFQSSSTLMGYLRDSVHGRLCKTPIIKQQMLKTLACMKTGFFSSVPNSLYDELT